MIENNNLYKSRQSRYSIVDESLFYSKELDDTDLGKDFIYTSSTEINRIRKHFGIKTNKQIIPPKIKDKILSLLISYELAPDERGGRFLAFPKNGENYTFFCSGRIKEIIADGKDSGLAIMIDENEALD